jgi:phage I-like protein
MVQSGKNLEVEGGCEVDKHFGWWVDLSKVTLSDTATGAASWVHALPVGEYQHPLHGKLDFSPTKLAALAASVKNKTRGIVPDIDYDHKEDPAKGRQAAGWADDAEVRNDGLYLHVDWTPDAVADIKNKKYRYFSAEFTDTWTDPTGKVHQDVLMGGGLTNRPFMKNLMPVNLSELIFTQPDEGGQDEVDGKKLRAALGLAETTTDDEVFTKLGELGVALKDTTEKVTKLAEEKTALETEVAKLKAGEDPKLDPELKKLIEASPAFAKLYETLETKNHELIKLQEGIKLAEVEKRLAELQTGKTFAIAPSAKEGLRALMLKMPQDGMTALTEFLVSVTEGKALVDLSERGYTGRREPLTGDATVRFNEAIQAEIQRLTEAKLPADYGTAVENVSRNNPRLFEEYREGTYLFKA